MKNTYTEFLQSKLSPPITKGVIKEFKPLASFKALKEGGRVRTLRYLGSAINQPLCSIFNANKSMKAGRLMGLFPNLFEWEEAEIGKAGGGLFIEYEKKRRVDPRELKLSAIEIEVDCGLLEIE